ncbi:hypothetical protein [Endozoicomonas sp. SESOKO2]|uniref:hypothetical protein n=1 Tax=Endozoicomonas sp. SESOKO2 TaxID=2828743 RepID=UPI0021472264|nr:hypothetical protein [Endozoicomonas sp. SESOKO2]
MNNSASQLSATARQSIFFHRNMANQSVAASLGLIMMACPCSELLAKNGLSTPSVERLVLEKPTKESSFLDDLINHNAYVGNIPTLALNPNATNLVFAMNYENEQGEKKDENSTEPEGATAQPLQSLIEIPLPVMLHGVISEIIRAITTDINTNHINMMLEEIPETPPEHARSIASMIDHLIKTLGITLNENQNALISVLYDIQGAESPVDISKPQQRESLAMLLMSYYTALKSNGSSPQMANVFFNSFLLHAVGLSGIGRLHATRGNLLGIKEPIEDPELLKGNVKESKNVFSALKILEEARLDFLQQLNFYSEDERSSASPDPLLAAATSLLNYGVEKNGIPLYKRNIKSHKRMLKLIESYGENNPKLVASNNQFMTLIHAISMLLDPSVIQFTDSHIENLLSYFRKSKWLETDTDSSDTTSKEQRLFEAFKKVSEDAKYNDGNEGPELFGELLQALKDFIEKQLQIAFTEADDYQVIMVTLGTGLASLHEQSNDMLEIFDRQIDAAKDEKAAEGQEGEELSKYEKKARHLRERISHLREFVEWFGSNYEFAMNSPHESGSSESEGNDVGSTDADRGSDSNRGDADGVDADVDADGVEDDRVEADRVEVNGVEVNGVEVNTIPADRDEADRGNPDGV